MASDMEYGMPRRGTQIKQTNDKDKIQFSRKHQKTLSGV